MCYTKQAPGIPARATHLPRTFPCAIRAAYPLLPSLILSIEFLSRRMAFRQLDMPISPVRMASPPVKWRMSLAGNGLSLGPFIKLLELS